MSTSQPKPLKSDSAGNANNNIQIWATSHELQKSELQLNRSCVKKTPQLEI